MTAPAGWYEHPQDAAWEAYWDGVQWTGSMRERRPAPPTTAHPSPTGDYSQSPAWDGGVAPERSSSDTYQRDVHPHDAYQDGTHRSDHHQSDPYLRGPYRSDGYPNEPRYGDPDAGTYAPRTSGSDAGFQRPQFTPPGASHQRASAPYAGPGAVPPAYAHMGSNRPRHFDNPERRRPGIARIAAFAVAAVLLVAVGSVAVGQLTQSGAETPQAAGEALVAALEGGDVIGMLDVLLPAEREMFRDPFVRGLGELRRLGIVGDDFDAGSSVVSYTIEDMSIRTEDVAADIVNVYIAGNVAGSLRSEIELGPVFDGLPNWEGVDTVGDLFDAAALGSLDMSTSNSEMMVTAVEFDGRWYLSMLYTLAEMARESSGTTMPAVGITPVGAASPAEAVSGYMDAVERLDLEELIARLYPGEFGAVQRYGPMFVGDAQDALDSAIAEAGFNWEVVGIDVEELDVDGNRARVLVRSLEIRVVGDFASSFQQVLGETTQEVAQASAASVARSANAILAISDGAEDPETALQYALDDSGIDEVPNNNVLEMYLGEDRAAECYFALDEQEMIVVAECITSEDAVVADEADPVSVRIRIEYTGDDIVVRMVDEETGEEVEWSAREDGDVVDWFGDDSVPSILTVTALKYNGSWYLAPVSTMFDWLLDSMSNLTTEDLRTALEGLDPNVLAVSI